MIEWDLVHIPKTGGRSVVTAIGYREQDHRRASECKGFLATFVRNPLSRFVSAFDFLRNPKWQQCVISPETTFREFVLDRQFEVADTTYFKPMRWWLDAPVGFVGRFETLEDDFHRLSELVGLKQRVELPKIHVRVDAADWHDWYDDDTLRVVRDYYSDDITRFGYGTANH